MHNGAQADLVTRSDADPSTGIVIVVIVFTIILVIVIATLMQIHRYVVCRGIRQCSSGTDHQPHSPHSSNDA